MMPNVSKRLGKSLADFGECIAFEETKLKGFALILRQIREYRLQNSSSHMSLKRILVVIDARRRDPSDTSFEPAVPVELARIQISPPGNRVLIGHMHD
jgi:hypothetical protein